MRGVLASQNGVERRLATAKHTYAVWELFRAFRQACSEGQTVGSAQIAQRDALASCTASSGGRRRRHCPMSPFVRRDAGRVYKLGSIHVVITEYAIYVGQPGSCSRSLPPIWHRTAASRILLALRLWDCCCNAPQLCGYFLEGGPLLRLFCPAAPHEGGVSLITCKGSAR